jgi:hypothetical protein
VAGGKAHCAECGTSRSLRRDGRIWYHRDAPTGTETCPGAGELPARRYRYEEPQVRKEPYTPELQRIEKWLGPAPTKLQAQFSYYYVLSETA